MYKRQVVGIVRSVEEYGTFVEIAPNLAGLAETCPDLHPGQAVSVYICLLYTSGQQAAAQDLQRLILILELAALILALHHHSGRDCLLYTSHGLQ